MTLGEADLAHLVEIEYRKPVLNLHKMQSTGASECTSVYMTSMSASQARAALPEILDRVTAGEEVTITRHGRAVAIVVRPDALRVRRADRALVRRSSSVAVRLRP